MTRLFPILALAAGLLAPLQARAGDVVRRAIVVGANDGGSLLESLRYAEDDADRVGQVLEELGGFDAQNVLVLHTPTVSQLAIALDEVAQQAQQKPTEDSLFLFYYSGHADEVGLQMAGGRLTYEELKQAIRQVPAKVHLGVLDACRSGAITQVKGASVTAPFLQKDPLATQGEAWIAASAATEDAQESEMLQGSFFTYYLLSGLRGAADGGDEDGFVSLNEAYKYAYDRTVARTTGTMGGTQHPAYDFQIQGNGDLALTEVRDASARISLPAAISGEVVVLRLPEATPVAEVAKRGDKAVTVALEPGRYLLRRRVDGGVQEVTISLAEGSELVVDRWGDTVAEVASLKGGEGTADGTSKNHVVLRLPISMSEEPVQVSIPKLDWTAMRHSPAIAGGLSSAVPGLGQMYSHRWGRGAFFMASTITLYSAGWAIAMPGSVRTPTGPNPITFLAFAMHGWALSDAVWGVHKRETFQARKGLTLALEQGWTAGGQPTVGGLSIDLFPNETISLGLDRMGFVVRPDTMTWGVGTRLTAGPSWRRWRLAGLVAVGSRILVPRAGAQGDMTTALPDPRHVDIQFVLGAGGLAQFYLTPRYYVQTEGRAQWVDGRIEGVAGLGMGFHIGK